MQIYYLIKISAPDPDSSDPQSFAFSDPRNQKKTEEKKLFYS